jgi:hypothetical protein
VAQVVRVAQVVSQKRDWVESHLGLHFSGACDYKGSWKRKAWIAYLSGHRNNGKETKMAYLVLADAPAQCVYMVIGCSPFVAADFGRLREEVAAIKAVRQMVMNPQHVGGDSATCHPLYGLREAKNFVKAIIARIANSTTVIIEMEPIDSWRHRAIIGAVLATLGVSYDKIETR